MAEVAGFALVVVVGAVFDALEDELGYFFVEAEGLGDVGLDAGVEGGGGGDEVGDVGGGVSAGGEEVGVDEDEVGALGDAAFEGVGDGGIGEFHVGGFDDGATGDPFEEGDYVEEHVIGGGAFGAVIDEDDAEGLVRELDHAGAFCRMEAVRGGSIIEAVGGIMNDKWRMVQQGSRAGLIARRQPEGGAFLGDE